MTFSFLLHLFIISVTFSFAYFFLCLFLFLLVIFFLPSSPSPGSFKFPQFLFGLGNSPSQQNEGLEAPEYGGRLPASRPSTPGFFGDRDFLSHENPDLLNDLIGFFQQKARKKHHRTADNHGVSFWMKQPYT